MIGLGVGIDYALFIVTRHRGFLHEGRSVEESAGLANATAGSGGAVRRDDRRHRHRRPALAGIPSIATMGLRLGDHRGRRHGRRGDAAARAARARRAPGSTAAPRRAGAP